MSNDIEREAFEKEFPVPMDVYWSADFEQYEARQMDSEPDADEYHRMWQVWQAARAQPEQPSAGVVPEGWFRCPDCGTHEVEISQQCNNSDCRGYNEDLTLYEGWKDTHPTDSGQER